MKMTGYVKSIEEGYQTRPNGVTFSVLRVLIVGANEAEAMIEVAEREGKTYYVGRRVTVETTPR